MSLFDIFRKNKKEDSAEMTENEKQIAKAKEGITEKGPDSQTEKDRIDESVGEQEKQDGNENSQSAKDRVDESEGAEKADEEHAADDGKTEAGNGLAERVDKLVGAVERLVSAFAQHAQMKQEQHEREAEKATDEEASELSRLENIYN